MKTAFLAIPRARDRARGIALIIVLAFIVLLTGLLLAFFSKAMLDRQISNSSASQTKVDLFLQGAVDSIVGDLKQEITAGSNAVALASGGKVYYPKAPAAAAPALVGTTASGGYENLVKRSANGQSFYPTANYDSNAANRAANVSTLAPSLNGRAISPSRWNKHLLLEKASALANGASDTNDTVFTPVGATEASGSTSASWTSAPDWILVDHDGSNPTTLSSPSTIVGRYAYAIYDEGGLLDMNVAGYPGPSPVMTPQQTGYKNTLAFADLKQLPGISSLPSGRQDDIINAIVGWRNGASASTNFSVQPPVPASVLLQGTFPNYLWSASSIPSYGTNYAAFLAANTNGFLKTSNPLTINGQTDRMFPSRQELMRLLLQGAATSDRTSAGSIERANLQNTLRCLGTFSRGINQPSYAPNAGRPKIVGDGTNNGGNNAYSEDDQINPHFPELRVTQAFVRNDATPASVGDPLVARRFNLNRLAWLTYKGPIATASGQISTDPDIQKMSTYLQNNYGYSLKFLQQGTPANVYKYFGLSWVSDSRANGDGQMKWLYDHSQKNPSGSTGASPVTGITNTGAGIMHLDQICTSAYPREPDFVELLQGTLAAGSKAKPATVAQNFATGTSNSNGAHIAARGDADDFDNGLDSRLDLAILQTTANIIDQFDLDGYPTRILLNNTTEFAIAKEVRGVENLPYFYRIRGGTVQGGSAQVDTTAKTVSSTGFTVNMQFPEIWNPHDSMSPACAVDTAGNYLTDGSAQPLFPTSFRFVIESTDPDHTLPGTNTTPSLSQMSTATYSYVRGDNQTGSNYQGSGSGYVYGRNADMQTPVAAPFSGAYNSATAFNLPTFPLTAENTALAFNVPASQAGRQLFREPTLLMSPLLPTGSNLAAAGSRNMLNAAVAYANTIPSNHANIKPNLSGGGIRCIADNKTYLGVYLGTLPVVFHWVNASSVPYLVAPTDVSPNFNGLGTETFRMQCQNGTGPWMTYDEKYSIAFRRVNQIFYTMSSGTPTNYTQNNGMLTAVSATSSYDPRTSRFGMPFGSSTYAPPYTNSNAPPLPSLPNWLDMSNNVTVTTRPGTGTGYFLSTTGYGGGSGTAVINSFSFPAPGMGWSVNNMAPMNYGLISQNDPNYTPNMADIPGGVPAKQYYADADGVVRRAMGAYADNNNTVGMPLATATIYQAGNASANAQAQSRPLVLNRPFRSVGELGYVFSGTPWKNLDFFTQESGDSALLDVFCTTDTTDPDGMMAGVIDLNTRQAPVLQAIMAGAYKDEQASFSSPPTWKLSPLTGGNASEAAKVATALTSRTASTATGKGPLGGANELVGRFVSGTSYDGFTTDLTRDVNNNTVFGTGNATSNVQRFREAPIRALASVGQTRVWNLLIDVVAQTGRYPANSVNAPKPLAAFAVEGEQHYWVHLAIDRLTGKVIDKQIEVVKE